MFSAPEWCGYAAVLVPLLIQDGEFSLILTQRSQTLRHHRGEVAFPGGMWEPNDQFPIATALRETQEEIALGRDDIDIKGILPTLSTGRGTPVSPVVAIVSPSQALEANPDEIDEIFVMPLKVLWQDKRLRTDIFQRPGALHWAPAYRYQGHEIWGFTAEVIKLLLAACFNFQLSRRHSAPEKRWP